MSRRVLVAGIGNELFGDDGFGVAVIERMAKMPQLPGVSLLNAGIRGLDLTCGLLADYDAAILVDASVRGGPPGKLYVLEPNTELDLLLPAPAPEQLLDGHRLDPSRVLLSARANGARLSWLRVVACEPSPELEVSMELSPPVKAALQPALSLVRKLIAQALRADVSGREAS